MTAHIKREWKSFAAVPAAVLAIIAFAFFMSRPDPAPKLPVVEESKEIGGGSIEVEIADSVEERTKGLSGREMVPEGYGMLFVFEEKGSYNFWMKDMLVPIDIIWLRDDGTIIGIERNVSPDTYPKTFTSPEPVRYVLETAVGEAERQGWDIGSTISIH